MLDKAATLPQYQILTNLTHREPEILGLFAAGVSVSEAARLTGRSFNQALLAGDVPALIALHEPSSKQG